VPATTVGTVACETEEPNAGGSALIGGLTTGWRSPGEPHRLRRFWELEAEPLHRAMREAGCAGAYPVPQAGRDPLFTRWRLLKTGSA
jgi:hypothetical protein